MSFSLTSDFSLLWQTHFTSEVLVVSTKVSIYIDDFEFAMNSINWIIDMQITEKRSISFVRLCDLVGKMVVQCFDVNRKKNCDDQRSGLPSICFQHRKEICMKVRTINTIFTLENCCCREAASRLSAIHHSYSRNIGAQTANIQFALVSFSCFFFWAKKTPHTVSM